MRILVLGASGYVGSKIKEVLLTEYQEIYGTYFTTSKDYEKDSFMFRYELGEDDILKSILEVSNPDIVISSITGDFSCWFKRYM